MEQNQPKLLGSLDKLNRKVDRSGMMEGMDGFERQAFELILGGSRDAFDLNKEDPKVRSAYPMDLKVA